MAVHPWHSYEQQPIALNYRVHVSTRNAVDQLSGQPGMHQHHGSSNISAAMEAPCQASVISAQVVLISKLTMQGSAG